MISPCARTGKVSKQNSRLRTEDIDVQMALFDFWPVLTAGRISDLHWRTIVWFNAWI